MVGIYNLVCSVPFSPVVAYNLVHFVLYSPVVLAYNIPGVNNLVLKRDQIVGIYNGTIRYWNDTYLQVSYIRRLAENYYPSVRMYGYFYMVFRFFWKFVAS